MINCIPFCRVWASRNLLVNCSLHPKRTHHHFCCLLMAAFILIFFGNGTSLPTHMRPAPLKSHFSPKAYSAVALSSPLLKVRTKMETCHLVPPCAEVFAPVSFEPAP